MCGGSTVASGASGASGACRCVWSGWAGAGGGVGAGDVGADAWAWCDGCLVFTGWVRAVAPPGGVGGAGAGLVAGGGWSGGCGWPGGGDPARGARLAGDGAGPVR